MRISSSSASYQAQTRATHNANSEEKTHSRKKADYSNGQSENEAIKVTISDKGKNLSYLSRIGLNINDLDPSKNLKLKLISKEEYQAYKAEQSTEQLTTANATSTANATATAATKGVSDSELMDANSDFWRKMVYSGYYDVSCGNDYASDVSTQAKKMEEAKMLAEHVASNYFDDPSEANDFIETIKFKMTIAEGVIARDNEKFDSMRMFALKEMGYTDETYINPYTLSKDDSAGHMRWREQMNDIIMAMKRRQEEDAAKGLAKGIGTFEEREEFGKYAMSEEGKAEAEEAFKLGNADRFAELNNQFYLYAQKFLDWTKAKRENADLIQSLIDNGKAQARATPIEELLAKYNISVNKAA